MDSNSNKPLNTPLTIKNLLQFVIPSVLGLYLFIVPVRTETGKMIPVAYLAKVVQGFFGNYLTTFSVILMCLTAVLSLFQSLKSQATEKNFFQTLFQVQPVWLAARIFAAVFATMAYFQIGIPAIYDKSTGGFILRDLLPILYCVFVFAGFLLPLLLNFGLMEFTGTLLEKFMRPLFKLPGRSAVDCAASWIGDGSIGILLTSKQYEQGFYTEQEAAIVGTMFSFVSVTFSIVILSYAKLEHLFIPFYSCVIVVGLLCAFIIPRIPPLSRKAKTYYGGKPNAEIHIEDSSSKSQWKLAITKASTVARQNASAKKFTKEGIQNVFDMWIGVIPLVMTTGTLALLCAEYTTIFDFIGMPFVPLLELFHIPYATEVAKSVVVGFADMFLPIVLAANIPSDESRFFIATLSVTQLIFMSETGGLLLGSKIPVNFLDLLLIFLQRTFISIPVIVFTIYLIM